MDPGVSCPSPKGKRYDEGWYLSFDCATKSLAFSLLRVRRPTKAWYAAAAAEASEAAAAAAAGEGGAARRLGERLDRESRGLCHLAAGGVVDLCPGRAQKEIGTVERVKALVAFLEGTVAPALAAAAGCPPPSSPALKVAVEYQMVPNEQARKVAVALVTHYAAAGVFLVGPALKNTVAPRGRPDLHHAAFVEKYRSRYTANKRHAEALYHDYVAPLFGHRVEGVPRERRADFADSVLQVLGWVRRGGEKARNRAASGRSR